MKNVRKEPEIIPEIVYDVIPLLSVTTKHTAEGEVDVEKSGMVYLTESCAIDGTVVNSVKGQIPLKEIPPNVVEAITLIRAYSLKHALFAGTIKEGEVTI